MFRTCLGPDLSKLTVNRCFGFLLDNWGHLTMNWLLDHLKNSTSKETNRVAKTTLGNDDNCSSWVLFRIMVHYIMLSIFLHVLKYSILQS